MRSECDVYDVILYQRNTRIELINRRDIYTLILTKKDTYPFA